MVAAVVALAASAAVQAAAPTTMNSSQFSFSFFGMPYFTELFFVFRGDPMKIFAQFFGGEDPFATFFTGGGPGGGMHGMGPGGSTMFFTSGGGPGGHMNGKHNVTPG